MKQAAFKNTNRSIRRTDRAGHGRKGISQQPPASGIAAADQPSAIQARPTVGSAKDGYEKQAEAGHVPAMARHADRLAIRTRLQLTGFGQDKWR